MDITSPAEFISDIIKIKLKNKFNRPVVPRILVYNVTSRCNCNCPMCAIRLAQPSDQGPELNINDMEKMFSDDMCRHFHLVRFTGGEPFIKDDFVDIANMVINKSRAKIAYITTNGYFTERIVELVKSIKNYHSCRLHLQISLDGIGDIHDKIRKVSGLFDRAYNTLASLKALSEHQKLSVGISQTIIRENVDQIKAINNLAMDFGFTHYLSFASRPTEAFPISPNESNLVCATVSNFSENELSGIRRMIGGLKKKQKGQHMAVVDFLRDIAEDWYIERFRLKNQLHKFRCLASFVYFRLTPDGFIIPCILKSDLKIGNIKNEKFSAIWNSKKAAAVREKVKSCAGCWVWCDIMPSFYYSGLFISELFRKTLCNIFKSR